MLRGFRHTAPNKAAVLGAAKSALAALNGAKANGGCLDAALVEAVKLLPGDPDGALDLASWAAHQAGCESVSERATVLISAVNIAFGSR